LPAGHAATLLLDRTGTEIALPVATARSISWLRVYPGSSSYQAGLDVTDGECPPGVYPLVNSGLPIHVSPLDCAGGGLVR